MSNFQSGDDELEQVSQAVGESELISVAHDVANFVQLGRISPCASAGIPKVFVIGADGMIDWIDDPVELPAVLLAIRDGEFDRQAAHVADEEHVADARVGYDAGDQFDQAFKAKDYDRAVTVADGRLEAEPENYAWLGMKYEALVHAKRHARINDVLRKLSKA